MTTSSTTSAHVPDIDRLLACRGLRHHTLGPTGGRLFCVHLDNALGVRGRFAALYDRPDTMLPDPIVLRLKLNGEPLQAPRAACMWYPSHARRQTTEKSLAITEYKFITTDDVICDVVELANQSNEPLQVRLEAETGAAEVTRAGRDTLAAVPELLGERAYLLLAMPTTRSLPAHTLVCDMTLQPGESTSLMVALAVGLRHGEAQAALKRWATSEDPVALQRREVQEWFERTCPSLECPDERFTRLWWYRWFLLRHNLVASPEGPHFHEARQGEHARLRLAGAPLVLQEARWLRDPAFVHGEINALLSAQQADGLYASLPPEPRAVSAPPREWLPAALWGAFQVWPGPSLIKTIARSVTRHLAALRELCDPDHNLLLGGGAGPLLSDEAPDPPVEAVDHSAMFAASLQAAGEMLALAGKEVDARWHEGLAERCRAAIQERLWDDWDHFFYDLERATSEPQRVPRAGGFAPFAFGVTGGDQRYAPALALLVDENHFWTAHPVPQTSRSAAGASGPVLPCTNSLIAEALAAVIRDDGQQQVTRRRLMDFLWLYAGLHFEDGDLARPLLRETYDALSGEGVGALDCLQSSFNDLVVRHVAGLTPRPDEMLEIAPLCTGWDWFALRNVPYRGHLISVLWDARPPQDPGASSPGLSVYVDGNLAAQSPQLERLVVPLEHPSSDAS